MVLWSLWADDKFITIPVYNVTIVTSTLLVSSAEQIITSYPSSSHRCYTLEVTRNGTETRPIVSSLCYLSDRLPIASCACKPSSLCYGIRKRGSHSTPRFCSDPIRVLGGGTY
ncbi:hypothetical protein BDR04DRAFT_146711 [Suillus decipiens]|nr:hypothetical protein BDR04DRAFT_146711 [Suillus decipiens]